jgi:ketosteroid isomerase-like protein
VPHDGAESFKAALEAFNRRDFDGIVADVDPDVEFHVPGGLPDADVYRGPEEVKRWAVMMLDAFDDLQLEFGEFREVAEETVLVPVRSVGHGRESGVKVEASFFMLGTGRDGRLVRMEWFATEDEALAAVPGAAGPT